METYEAQLQKLVDGLKKAFGEALESVVLYGSAAASEYHAKHSDLNILVVMKNSDSSRVGRARKIARWWNSTGNPPLLFFTMHEMKESADVFPMEFSDMKEAHRILFGSDPLADLKVDRRHLRLECEHELRGKLLSLRSRHVLALGHASEATSLLARSLSTFAVLFRHALALVGHPVSFTKAEVFTAAAQEFNFDSAPFMEMLAVRKGERTLSALDLDAVFEKYFEGIQKVIERVDQLAS